MALNDIICHVEFSDLGAMQLVVAMASESRNSRHSIDMLLASVACCHLAG